MRYLRIAEMLVSHFVIPNVKYFGGFLPYVFTPEGGENERKRDCSRGGWKNKRL